MDEVIQQEKAVDISFFIPCLNEERNIINTLNNVSAAMEEVSYLYEIIIIDDNSTDLTVKVVENFIGQHPDVSVILRKNKKTL